MRKYMLKNWEIIGKEVGICGRKENNTMAMNDKIGEPREKNRWIWRTGKKMGGVRRGLWSIGGVGEVQVHGGVTSFTPCSPPPATD